MQRRTFPSILLYGFGLVLALSLLFNGFLLVEQSRLRSLYDYEFGALARPVDYGWQEDYSAWRRAIQQKDSLRQLKQLPAVFPDSAGLVRQATTN